MSNKEDFDLFNGLFTVDFVTGKLFWKIAKSPIYPGKEAGHTDRTGYSRVCVNKRMYLVHRVIFLLGYGRWPVSILDHINQNPSDNRLENLRESNLSENAFNSKIRSDNSSGERGVYKAGTRWYAMKRRKWLGYFNTKQAAAEAYRNEP